MVCVFVKRQRSKETSTTTSSISISPMPSMAMSLPLLTLALLLTPTPVTITPTAAGYNLLMSRDVGGGISGRGSGSGYSLGHPSPFYDDDTDDCDLCFATDDPILCRRCYSERSFVPRFYQTSARDDAAADALAQLMAPPAEKRSYYEPMRRFQRGSGCSCCYFSRLTNAGCCAACRMTTKKRKRSVTASGDAESALTSEQGDVTASVNCRCCLLSGSKKCCGGCLSL